MRKHKMAPGRVIRYVMCPAKLTGVAPGVSHGHPYVITICLVLSGNRVQTCTLCGPNRPGTGPNITASALES